MKRITKELKSAIEQKGLTVEFGDGYVDIARADGVYIEFEGNRDGDCINMFASYCMGKGQEDVSCQVGFDKTPEEFAQLCKAILHHSCKRCVE